MELIRRIHYSVVFVLSIFGVSVADGGEVLLRVQDEQGQLVPCRIHIENEAGEPELADGLPSWRDHFSCRGEARLNPEPGLYTFLVERGPEFTRRTGSFRVTKEGEPQAVSITVARIAHMAKDGWYSGDLHVHRPVDEVELLMRAEDLHIAPVTTWWNDRNMWQDRKPPADLLVRHDGNRFYYVMAGEDEREGGALLYFHLKEPLPITGASREIPSPMKFVAMARQRQNVWIDIEKPFWWDVPVWAASGQVDSIGLANNHMCHHSMYESEAWGKPRDEKRLPPPLGNGFWTQEIYYRLLNSGLRIPPSAGSASGVLPNPVGYNRVYVYVGDGFSYDNWWSGLKAGRSFVTNGPLLVTRANNQLPGHVFTEVEGGSVEIKVDVSLITQDDVSEIEIIRNGRVEQSVPVKQLDERNTQTRSGQLGTIRFEKSGWFLIRVIAQNRRTFRFASTAPYYVEVGESRHYIEQEAAQFFLDWVDERIERVKKQVTDSSQLADVLSYHHEAREFWLAKVQAANGD